VPGLAGPAAVHTRAQVLPPAAGADHGDDVLAAVLIRMWALASGRTLRSDIPPGQLTPAELIDFWADDFTSASGRHAAGAISQEQEP
jgi:hypothetical protein